VVSIYFATDAFLALNDLFDGHLLKCEDDSMSATDIAVKESGYLKRLVGAVRASFRNSARSRDKIMQDCR
jgi:hypothetical protein